MFLPGRSGGPLTCRHTRCADDMGWGDWSLTGSPALTPNLEAWAKSDHAVWFDRFYAEDVTYQGYGPGVRTADRDGLKELAYTAARLFPDRRMTVKRLVAEGDTVAIETEWTGTATDGHPILKSGERQVIRNILFNRYRDGKIVETREFSALVSGSSGSSR